MMVLPVAFDMTRLATRVLNLTPNAIDRIDFAFARHFLEPARQDRLAIIMTPLGPRAIAAAAARDIVDGISIHWGKKTRLNTMKAIARLRLGSGVRSRHPLRFAGSSGDVPVARLEFYDGSARTVFPSAALLPPLCRRSALSQRQSIPALDRALFFPG